MAEKMTINERRSAQRCEICHQSDMFDGMTEICDRCLQVQIAIADKIAESESRPAWVNLASAFLVGLVLALGFFLASRLFEAPLSGAFFMAWMGVACVVLSRKFGVVFLD